MPYEARMTISLLHRQCIVFFRGQKHTLPNEYDNFADAQRAGEEFCRQLGWVDKNSS
jgi:hypothetical protein